jgi:hypothetical protein
MSVEENKKVAHMYHDLNPDEVEVILTPDFIGHGPDGHTWNRDSHIQTWRVFHDQLKDTIHEQVAEGDSVATWFTRSGNYENKPVNWEMMQFKRFVGGKISEVWEIYSENELGK